jgi:hypothetical protein
MEPVDFPREGTPTAARLHDRDVTTLALVALAWWSGVWPVKGLAVAAVLYTTWEHSRYIDLDDSEVLEKLLHLDEPAQAQAISGKWVVVWNGKASVPTPITPELLAGRARF